MEKQSSISFVIPVYNAEEVIIDNIEKIINNRKNHSIELILIDDGSIDKSSEICKSYSLKYPWIQYYRKDNGGVSSARNKGIELASGDWIYFIDADDMLMDNAIDVLVDLISNNNTDIIITGYDTNKLTCEERKKAITKKAYEMKLLTLDSRYLKKDKHLNDAFLLWTCWGKLYRKNFLIENRLLFSSDLTLGEDIFFLLNCYDYCSSVEVIFQKTYFYNSNDNSASRGFNNKRVANTKNLAELYSKWAICQERSIQYSVKKFIVQRALACISKYYLHNQNNMDMDKKISDFAELCSTSDINNAIKEVRYVQFLELRKLAPVYLVSLFLLKNKAYRRLFKLYKFVQVY